MCIDVLSLMRMSSANPVTRSIQVSAENVYSAPDTHGIVHGSIRSTSEFEDHNHWPCRYALDKTYPFLNADFLAWGAVETHYALVEVLVYKIPAEYHAVNDIIAVGA